MMGTLCGLLIAVLAATVLTGCGTKKLTQPYTVSGFYFDTFVSFTIYEDPQGQEHAEKTAQELKNACEYYEAIFSATEAGSDVSRINEAQGKPVHVSSDTASLLSEALYYAELTNGAFDPTMKVISDLWNIRSEDPQIPDEESMLRAGEHVDYHKVLLEDNTVTLLDPDARIDLGGIAKGFIADRLKDYLTEQGITSAIISLGGNILTIGSKPDGTPFVIGLQKPFSRQGDTIAAVSVQDQTVVTSGNYERYFEKDGNIYHHIMDPITCAPVVNDLNAVTIVSESSTEADALSTACYVLGTEKSRELLKTLPHTEALFIDRDNQILTSDSFENEILTYE